jgi:hypothetical protein
MGMGMKLQPKEILHNLLMSEYGQGLETEHRFHPTRKWRFDYAWPEQMIAIEYEGIKGSKARHTTLTGYTNDCDKYNQAVLLGWKVLRFTTVHFSIGRKGRCGQTIDFIRRTLNHK